MTDASTTERSYAAQRADPRWQRMRLDAFQRDDFRCRCCGNNEAELHAHHSYYERGKAAWEYPLESIITYCHGCHEAEHGRGFAADAGVLQLLRKAGFATVSDRVAITSAFVRDGPALSVDELCEIEIIIRALVAAPPEFRAAIMERCLEREREH
jgi:DNA-binding transcriptional LysR family regulator